MRVMISIIYVSTYDASILYSLIICFMRFVTAYVASILYYLSLCHFLWLSLPMMPLFSFNWAYAIFATTLLTVIFYCLWLMPLLCCTNEQLWLNRGICHFLWFCEHMQLSTCLHNFLNRLLVQLISSLSYTTLRNLPLFNHICLCFQCWLN